MPAPSARTTARGLTSGKVPSSAAARRLPGSARLAVASWVMLAATAYPWETGNYYSGAASGRQVIKAVVEGVALAFALLANAGRKQHLRPSRVALSLVAVLGAASTLGALLPNVSLFSAYASEVAAGRLLLFFWTAYLVMRVLPGRQLWASQLAVLGAIIGAAIVETAIFGVSQSGGRLVCTYPPLPPNTVSFGGVILVLNYGVPWVRGKELASTEKAALLLGMVGLFATGTRGGLIAAGLGIVAVALTYKTSSARIGTLIFAGGLALLVIPFVLTHLASGGVYSRNAGVGLLNNRQVAWSAILSSHQTTSSVLIGNGLANTLVAIPFNGWTSTQVINNAWLQSYVQGGILGAVILAAYLGYAAGCARHAAPTIRPQAVAILVAVCVLTFSEAGILSIAPLGVILLAWFAWVTEGADTVRAQLVDRPSGRRYRNRRRGSHGERFGSTLEAGGRVTLGGRP